MHALQKVDQIKTISYGDPKAQLLLWQKAFMLVPIWGIAVIPIAGFIFQAMSKGAVQVGYGVMLSLFLIYFIDDVLKRKISFDNEHVFFGFRTMPIKDIVSIEVLYKNKKFLPADLVLNAVSGQKLKFSLDGLSDQNVESLVKHLQSNNSTLETASVLATLVKCRRARVKPLDVPQRLELPVHSRRDLTQAVDAYKVTAGKWVRLGPVMALGICVPFWSMYLSSLYVCLQPHSWLQLQQLGSNSFLFRAATAFLTIVSNLSSNFYTASKTMIENPALLIAEGLFFAALIFYVNRLYFQANSLVADGNGISLLFRSGFLAIPLKKLKWSEISQLKLFNFHDKFARIRFVKNNGKTFDLGVETLSTEHRALLLKRIEKFAPTCQIDQGLAELMLPKANQSYTEIWLQSLSQTPERATLDPLSPGQLVGEDRYEVLRKIGVGGQGTAYLCRDLHDKDELHVVLKETIIPVFANNATTLRELEKFEHEAKILQELKNPGVVNLMQYFIEDHRAYLVLEHVDGQSLAEIVSHDGALSEERVLDFAHQMTDVLSFLHERGVVHRDFTPDNLLLNSKGRLKLIDFNVAQRGESGLTGTIVGKHAYLPPEQFRGKATTRSDIYAFGATLFFLLTGQVPEPISQSSPRSTNSEVSEALNDVVKKATALKEDARYSDIAELKSALAGVKRNG